MSSDWSNLLKHTLLELKTSKPRVAIMGIGHELCGDDAAGVMVARALKPVFIHHQDILIIEGGHAPENQTGLLRRFAPDLVLLVDAAQMGESCGMVRWLGWQETSGLSASTHTLPLYVIAQYLHTELGCEVALLGIQPAQMTICTGLSPSVKQSVDKIVQSVKMTLRHLQATSPTRDDEILTEF
ncbi:MAG: hydrogenase 3 maturation endopeptidase HyCI [Anaerolineae bacterium]|nr:hydrogenase 3 maturation endopeptidase HyCI [Anaerolineae bacterium]